MIAHRIEFSHRLQISLNRKGLPERGRAALLATKFHVTPKAAGKWLNGESIPEIGKLIEVSKWLDESIEWLLTGEKNKAVSLDNNVDLSEKLTLGVKNVPVITWEQVASFGTELIVENMEIKKWLPPNTRCGENGYGLQIFGLSMSPNFVPGDFIYVNPDFSLEDLVTNDLVIISCNNGKEATFKKLIIEGNDKYLQPINPEWPEQIIKLTDDCKILGKVTGLFRDI